MTDTALELMEDAYREEHGGYVADQCPRCEVRFERWVGDDEEREPCSTLCPDCEGLS